MRKMILALAVVLLAAPAWATVTITLTKIGDTKVAIGYDATTESQLVRAFALDVSVTDGTIVGIENYAIGDDNHGYGVFPGRFSLYINVLPNGTVDNWDDPNYTPVAPADDPGALGGIGTSGATLEMGSLYDANQPAPSGTLCTVTVSAGTTTLCVIGNAIRGNIVMEDASEVIPLEACHTFITDCFPSSFTTYADWVTYGKPKCWCNTAIDPTATGNYQCEGDADGVTSGAPFQYRIYTNDLNAVVANWKKKMGAAGLNPCADIDHKSSGAPFQYRVYTLDLNKVVGNWKKKDAAFPGNCGTLARPE
jgi:hypothetical protein